jgi:hypothetical protein
VALKLLAISSFLLLLFCVCPFVVLNHAKEEEGRFLTMTSATTEEKKKRKEKV